MSTPLRPLPDLDPLTAHEVALALGVSQRHILEHARRGRFPGAYHLPAINGHPGRWRIPHAAAVKVGRQMGVLE